MKLRFSFSLLCCFVFTVNILAQKDTLKCKAPFTFEASYIGDAVRNFSGGIKKGSRYLGLANLKVSYDTKAARLWKPSVTLKCNKP